jgi:DNA-binding MarR family transcriptional regulator
MSTDGAAYADLISQIHRADLLSRRAADRQLSAQIGIGRSLFLVLEMLADAGPVAPSQQAVADRLGLTKAAVSRHLATGRQRKWVVVRPSARSARENTVRLTDAGRTLVEKGRRHRIEAERAAVAALGPQDLTITARTLERLCSLLDDRAG